MLPLSLLMKFESVTIQMNAIKQHFAVGLNVMQLGSMHSKLKKICSSASVDVAL